MLIAQPDAQLPDRRLPCILRKEATVPFVCGHIRRRDNALEVAVHVRAMRADILATDGQLTTKNGVRQDQLRRCEPVAHTIFRVHHAVFLHATRLHGMRARRAAARVEIDVEVDPQAAHRPVVIRIETVCRVVRRTACIVAMPFVVKGRVGVNHAVESRVVDVVAQGWRERVAEADVMLRRDLPIGASRDAHPPIDTRGVQRILLLPKCIEARLLRDATVDKVRPAAVKDGAEHVPAALAPIHVQLFAQVGRFALVPARPRIESEAISGVPHRVNADHRFHRSIVACAGIADNLHVAYVSRVQLI